MKTADNYFSGFPAVWNMAASICSSWSRRPGSPLGAVVALAVLTFAPIRFVHPLRVRHMRVVNIGLLVIWAVLAFLAVVQNLMPGPYVTWPMGFIAALLPDRRVCCAGPPDRSSTSCPGDFRCHVPFF